MVKPDATIYGLDKRGHIWVVLSDPELANKIAVVSLSKHGRPELKDHAGCTIIRRGEYQGFHGDKCVEMQSSRLMRWRPLLKALEDRKELEPGQATVDPDILVRIQRAVLVSEIPPDSVRKAVRQTVEPEA